MKIKTKLDFTDLTVGEFDKFVERKNFSILSPTIWPVHILNPVRCSYNGVDICIFQIGITDGSPGGAYQTGVFVRAASLNFPNFVLRPSRFGEKLRQLFHSSVINLSAAPVFSEKYRIKGDSGSRIRSLFKAEVIKYFEDNEGITVEANNNAFLIFKYRDKSDTGDYSKYIDRAFEVIELLTGQEL